MKISKALVTGGCGFIGSHIVDELLSREIETYVVDNLMTGALSNLRQHYHNKQLHVIIGDLKEINNLLAGISDIDVVFHEAAIASVPKSLSYPMLVHEANVNITLDVLNYCINSEVEKFVFASSAAVYGALNQSAAVESMDCKPDSPYGASKLGVEGYLHAYWKSYGLKTTALRYFNVFGPRQRAGDGGVIPIFINKFLNNEAPTIHGSGKQSVDFVHVKDIVQANILAAQSESAGNVFNVGTGRSTSIVELFYLIKQLTGSNLQPNFGSARPGDSQFSQASIEKIKDLLNYEPKTSLEQGLYDLIMRNDGRAIHADVI